MSKKTPAIVVSIPQPCSEDWATMTPEEKGRFCGSCQKVVLDFTAMSNIELIAALRTAGAGCGRFRVDQLDRPLYLSAVAAKPSGWDWRKAVAAVMVAGGLAKPAFAQMQKGAPGMEQTVPPQGVSEINGIITYEKNEPVIGATVVVKQGEVLKGGAQSDIDGAYTIKPLETGIYTLEVTFPGYTTRRVTDIRLTAGPIRVDVSLALVVHGVSDSGAVDSARFVPPLIISSTVAGAPLIAGEIERMGGMRNPLDVATLAPAGVYRARGGGLKIGDGRSENLVCIDGVPQRTPKKKSFWRRLLFWKD